MRGQNENRKNTGPPPPNNIKRNITTTRDEHIDHDPTDKVGRYHTDPTRAARIAEAIRLTRPLVRGILSLIERVLGNDSTAEGPLKAAVSAAYEKACEVVASVDLEIRRGVLEYTVVNTPGLGDGLKIEVEFTLAAPLDGSDAVMSDRHCYFGYGAEASEEFLLNSARRYWLCTKLWIPTETDAHPPEWVVSEEPPRADDPTTGTQP